MTVRTYAATALLAGASFLAIGAATPAYALCDSYSGGCPSAPPTNGGGGTDIGGGTDAPATGNENPPALGGGETGGTDTGGTDTGGADTGGADTGGADTGAGTGTGGETGGTGDGPGRAGTASIPSTPDTLPFTGGELVLMTAAGLGALAGGTALVVAGRRKAAAVA